MESANHHLGSWIQPNGLYWCLISVSYRIKTHQSIRYGGTRQPSSKSYHGLSWWHKRPHDGNCRNCKQVWDNLFTPYANKSRTRIYGLHTTLPNMVKNSKPVAEYLKRNPNHCPWTCWLDLLLVNDEMVITILTGLEPKHKEISAAIRARYIPITDEELFDTLVDHETFLKHKAGKKEPINITT